MLELNPEIMAQVAEEAKIQSGGDAQASERETFLEHTRWCEGCVGCWSEGEGE